MNGRFLLDTNILIALFANDADVLQELEQAEEVFVSSIALGELYYGARKSTRVEENVARIDALAASSVVLPCDEKTAQHYGQIKNLLRARGRPLPENDIWIAATAVQYELTLISRDAHFEQVEPLSVEAW